MKNEREDVLINEPNNIIENVKTEYKNILEDMKMNGRLQKIIFLHICLSSFICCLLITVFPLQKDLPKYECIPVEEFEDNPNNNLYRENKKRYKIIRNEHCIEKYCNKNEDPFHHEFQSPNLWVLVGDYYSITNFITELDLMCDIEGFFGRMTQMLFLGRIFGMVLFSYIADKYGRYICFYIQYVIILFSYLMFLFIKVKFVYLLTGFLVSSCLFLYNLTSVMSTEIMNQEMYSLLNGLIGAFFTLCGIIDILVLYFLKNWNILLFLHLFISGIVFFLSKTYLTEMPLYLLDNNEFSKLNEVIKKISIVNNTYEEKNINDKLLAIEKMLENNKDVPDKSLKVENITMFQAILGPYILIGSSRKNIKQLMQLVFIFLTMNLVFYGQLLNIEKMEGNVYFNSFIIYIGEIIAEVVAGYILQILGRKKLILVCFSLSTLFCFCVNFMDGEEMATLRTSAIFVNSFCISIAFITVYVYSAELFETNVKSTLISILCIISNVFMLIAPYLIEIFSTPFALFSVFSGIAALNSLLLKETKKSGVTHLH